MITSFATWDAVIIQACVEYSFVWSIDYGKRAWLFGTVFKQNVLKEEQYQSVLGLLGRDKRMLWRFFPRGFGKSLIYQLFAQWNTNKRKERGINCILITKYYYRLSWSNEKSWHFSRWITLPAAEPRGDVNILSKAIIVVLAFLKARFT